MWRSELSTVFTCPWFRVRSPSNSISELKFHGSQPFIKKTFQEEIIHPITSVIISIRVTMITNRTVIQQVDHHVEHMSYHARDAVSISGVSFSTYILLVDIQPQRPPCEPF
jgi:hypothetical protein